MPSLDSRAGNRYLTVAGAPVRVLEVHDGVMVLQSLASDNRSFDQEKATWEIRPAPCSARSKKVKGLPAPNKPLAPIIDAMLLAGGHTMRGLVRELRRKVSAAPRGRDLAANVRARIYWFRRRGLVIDSDELGRLKVLCGSGVR